MALRARHDGGVEGTPTCLSRLFGPVYEAILSFDPSSHYRRSAGDPRRAVDADRRNPGVSCDRGVLQHGGGNSGYPRGTATYCAGRYWPAGNVGNRRHQSPEAETFGYSVSDPFLL